ncbi:hypothetical protein [Streptomyces sp. NPDC088557]|uniref:hypothetical protein n=1 Tax=Streptomyces sp. NPDC088557 TaxID=3365867 RepID=UPI0038137275
MTTAEIRCDRALQVRRTDIPVIAEMAAALTHRPPTWSSSRSAAASPPAPRSTRPPPELVARPCRATWARRSARSATPPSTSPPARSCTTAAEDEYGVPQHRYVLLTAADPTPVSITNIGQIHQDLLHVQKTAEAADAAAPSTD